MGDLLDSGMVWLEDQRTRFMAQSVLFKRGPDSVQVPATIGQTMFQIDDGAGALIRFESRDFLILASDLVLASVPVLPKRGDQIQETQGTQVFIYEVSAPGGEPE